MAKQRAQQTVQEKQKVEGQHRAVDTVKKGLTTLTGPKIPDK